MCVGKHIFSSLIVPIFLGYSHGSGCTNSFNSRIDALASHDGDLRNTDSNAASSGTGSNLVFFAASQSIRAVGGEFKIKSSRASRQARGGLGHQQSKSFISHYGNVQVCSFFTSYNFIFRFIGYVA